MGRLPRPIILKSMNTIDVPTFGDIPLIVLSRGYDPDQDWQAMPVELLRFSSDSQQSIADTSGHTIELDQPQAGVAAIGKMVMQRR